MGKKIHDCQPILENYRHWFLICLSHDFHIDIVNDRNFSVEKFTLRVVYMMLG